MHRIEDKTPLERTHLAECVSVGRVCVLGALSPQQFQGDGIIHVEGARRRLRVPAPWGGGRAGAAQIHTGITQKRARDFRRRRRRAGGRSVSEHQSSASRRGLQSATNESERRAEEPPLRPVAGVASGRPVEVVRRRRWRQQRRRSADQRTPRDPTFLTPIGGSQRFCLLGPTHSRRQPAFCCLLTLFQPHLVLSTELTLKLKLCIS